MSSNQMTNDDCNGENAPAQADGHEPPQGFHFPLQQYCPPEYQPLWANQNHLDEFGQSSNQLMTDRHSDGDSSAEEMEMEQDIETDSDQQMTDRQLEEVYPAASNGYRQPQGYIPNQYYLPAEFQPLWGNEAPLDESGMCTNHLVSYLNSEGYAPTGGYGNGGVQGFGMNSNQMNFYQMGGDVSVGSCDYLPQQGFYSPANEQVLSADSPPPWGDRDPRDDYVEYALIAAKEKERLNQSLQYRALARKRLKDATEELEAYRAGSKKRIQMAVAQKKAEMKKKRRENRKLRRKWRKEAADREEIKEKLKFMKQFLKEVNEQNEEELKEDQLRQSSGQLEESSLVAFPQSMEKFATEDMKAPGMSKNLEKASRLDSIVKKLLATQKSSQNVMVKEVSPTTSSIGKTEDEKSLKWMNCDEKKEEDVAE